MHNFPKNIEVVCKQKHTLAQGKEILKLCIENSVVIGEEIQREVVDAKYPYFTYGNYSDILDLNGSYSDILDLRRDYNDLGILTVTLEEFKQFIIGKGKYKAPFNQKLKLNDEYTATVTKNKITVGCQEFSHETVKKLYLLSQKALKS